MTKRVRIDEDREIVVVHMTEDVWGFEHFEFRVEGLFKVCPVCEFRDCFDCEEPVYEQYERRAWNTMATGIYWMIRACVCAGVKIENEKFIKKIKAAIDSAESSCMDQFFDVMLEKNEIEVGYEYG